MENEQRLIIQTKLSPSEKRWVYSGQPRETGGPCTVDKAWVAAAFTETVRLNSEQIYTPSIASFRELPIMEDTSFSIDSLESNIVRAENEYADPEERILSVLLHSNFRRGPRELIASHIPNLQRQLYGRTRRANPVELVLPTLPFKDQNPLTTRIGPESIDLGEYLFMAQMRDIVHSVKNTYKPGIRLTLLTDGLVYANIFANGDTRGVEFYRERMRILRDQMGLRGSVDIIDMAWIVSQETAFNSVHEQVRDYLVELEDESEQIRDAMISLRHGMLFNIAAPEYAFDEYAKFTQIQDEEYPDNLRRKLISSSRDFASFLLAMKHLRIVQRAFPNAVRATVHPKDAAQIPLHLVNKSSRIFPYNGIPVVSSQKLEQTGSYRKSTRIMRFYEMLQYENAQGVYQAGDTDPLYYVV